MIGRLKYPVTSPSCFKEQATRRYTCVVTATWLSQAHSLTTKGLNLSLPRRFLSSRKTLFCCLWKSLRAAQTWPSSTRAIDMVSRPHPSYNGLSLSTKDPTNHSAYTFLLTTFSRRVWVLSVQVFAASKGSMGMLTKSINSRIVVFPGVLRIHNVFQLQWRGARLVLIV